MCAGRKERIGYLKRWASVLAALVRDWRLFVLWQHCSAVHCRCGGVASQRSVVWRMVCIYMTFNSYPSLRLCHFFLRRLDERRWREPQDCRFAECRSQIPGSGCASHRIASRILWITDYPLLYFYDTVLYVSTGGRELTCSWGR